MCEVMCRMFMHPVVGDIQWMWCSIEGLIHSSVLCEYVREESTLVMLVDQCDVGVKRQCVLEDVNRICNQGIVVGDVVFE